MSLVKLIGVSLALIFGLSTADAAQQPSSTYSVKHTTHTTVVQGTLEYAHVETWLNQHQVPGDNSQPPEYAIDLTTTSIGAQPNDVPGPPVPVPSSGRNGDTLTIQSCGGGVSQSWTFEYDSSAGSGSNGWVLVGYTYARTQACGGKGQGSGQ